MPADELPYGASWLGSSPEDIVKGDIAEHLLGLSQMCAKSHADLLDSYDSSKSITDKLGVRLVDDVLWSESDEQLTVQVLAALTAASQMLLEASRGDRAVAVSADKHDILIDGVSTDMFWIVWGSNEHTFALQTPAGAEFVVPSTLGIVTLSDPGKVTHPAMAVGDAYRLTVLGDKLGALVRGSAQAQATGRQVDLNLVPPVYVKPERHEPSWQDVAQKFLTVSAVVGGAYGMYKIIGEVGILSRKKELFYVKSDERTRTRRRLGRRYAKSI